MGGGFTLPGEAGFERLTLELAGKWGADCIRDSDGTQLSDEILMSGIPIYSTVCPVRSVNAWARRNMDKLQRNFLITQPVPALGGTLAIRPMEGFFSGQFTLCPKDDPKEFWEVWDRTAGVLLPGEDWAYSPEDGAVTIRHTKPGHLYTVSFLATRVWEEISMYNHLTNGWGDREHLMAVEPRYPEARQALLDFLEGWCREHPQTSVVRFTSMFYNFCWIWGSDPARPHLYSDWAGYDFTVNPVSLREFELEYGYRMTAEDFVAGGFYRPAHNPPNSRQLDWMAFTGRFVRAFARECVDLVHWHGKKAYVFYDDTWIGLEPWSGHFQEMGFDGLIKCVFNAFEARLCAGVEVKTHELRLHPYLFPVGLKGEPTFSPGGRPEEDARRYWACVRRALLRVKVDRIGLGGYLHLAEPFPAFVLEVARIADEFRRVKALHEAGAPWSTGVRIGVLHSWGSLRTWTCSGHLHEHPEIPLTHLWEALAGQPFEVRALSFDEVASGGVPEDIDVLINAGREGDAWSGGQAWEDPALREAVNAFVLRGGGFLGVKEPSAVRGDPRSFAMADALGVDRETGQTICHTRYSLAVSGHFITAGFPEVPSFANGTGGVYPLSPDTMILAQDGAGIRLAAHAFGEGRCVYMDGFTHSSAANRLLYRALLWLAGREELADILLPGDPALECAWFPESGCLLVFNGEDRPAEGEIAYPGGSVHVELPPRGTLIHRTAKGNSSSKPGEEHA